MPIRGYKERRDFAQVIRNTPIEYDAGAGEFSVTYETTDVRFMFKDGAWILTHRGTFLDAVDTIAEAKQVAKGLLFEIIAGETLPEDMPPPVTP